MSPKKGKLPPFLAGVWGVGVGLPVVLLAMLAGREMVSPWQLLMPVWCATIWFVGALAAWPAMYSLRYNSRRDGFWVRWGKWWLGGLWALFAEALLMGLSMAFLVSLAAPWGPQPREGLWGLPLLGFYIFFIQAGAYVALGLLGGLFASGVGAGEPAA